MAAMRTPGLLDPARRRASLAALAAGQLDLLVVGGGITGAGVALDAAARGLSVGLLERADLASGASSKSSKLIHGGLRYLEMGDLGLVREGLRERELLLTRLAPHLVSPVPFLWPLRHRVWERLYLGAGLVLYDTLGGARSVPRHRHLSRRGALATAPALSGEGITGAVQFHDAAEDDARMVVAVARTAASFGAHVVTRARVTRLLRAGDRITGAEVCDGESGQTLALAARHVLLAAGVWTDELRAGVRARFATTMRPSKGIHITVARERIPMSTGVLARTEKSVLFIIPTDAGWLIGDTDTPWSHGPDDPVASGADIDYLLAKANALLARPLTRADVLGVFAGLRPLVGAAGATDTTRLSRRHVVEAPVPGLTTIAGGKYTTYRAMAADAVDGAAREFPGLAASSTARIPLCGAERYAEVRAQCAGHAATLGIDPAGVARLLHRYGDRVEELLALCAEREELRRPLSGAPAHLAAEVVHACTHEGALHLEDVLERRTRLAITRADRAVGVAGEVAALMASALGWSEERRAEELAAFARRVAAARAGEAEPDDARALAAYRSVLAGGQMPAGVRR
jgi:glycerol-3-phosphate dehydrogenase